MFSARLSEQLQQQISDTFLFSSSFVGFNQILFQTQRSVKSNCRQRFTVSYDELSHLNLDEGTNQEHGQDEEVRSPNKKHGKQAMLIETNTRGGAG